MEVDSGAQLEQGRRLANVRVAMAVIRPHAAYTRWPPSRSDTKWLCLFSAVKRTESRDA